MSHRCSALLLLLGLASPAAVQAHTVFARTTHTDSARVDSVRAAASGRGGFAAGLSTWPTEAYCAGPMSATMQQVDPRLLLSRLQLAARCNVRLILVPPRRMLTTDGRPKGEFSVERAKQFTDRYAAVLPADTVRKYRAIILGLNLADDYTCLHCWGGRAITQEEIAEWAAYTRARLPGIPLGVRTTADWVEKYAPLAPELDYTWGQYATRKGDAKTYFDRAATIAQRLGLRVVMGINVENCYAPGTSTPCAAADLVRFGGMAVRHPESCAFVSWRYEPETWARPDVRAAWDELLSAANDRAAADCRREAGRA
jgi:hypothetical protein